MGSTPSASDKGDWSPVSPSGSKKSHLGTEREQSPSHTPELQSLLTSNPSTGSNVCECAGGGVCVQALMWGWGRAREGSVTKAAWALGADSGGHPQGAPSPHQRGPRQATHSQGSLCGCRCPWWGGGRDRNSSWVTLHGARQVYTV